MPIAKKIIEGHGGKIDIASHLDMLAMDNIKEDDFMPSQSFHQNAIWQRVGEKPTPRAVENAIKEAKVRDSAFEMEGSFWTNNLSWIQNYEAVLNPMHKLSVLFHSKTDNRPVDKSNRSYRAALLYLLVGQNHRQCQWWAVGAEAPHRR